jgi:hypothetical protein
MFKVRSDCMAESKEVLLTKAGLEKLEAELEYLKSVRRKRLQKESNRL